MQQAIEGQLTLLKCIADETRFKILLMLKDGDRCVCEIFRGLGKEQSLISHHLKTLRKCGIVEYRREGKRVRYRLADPSVLDLLTKVEELANAFCRVR